MVFGELARKIGAQLKGLGFDEKIRKQNNGKGLKKKGVIKKTDYF